VESPENDVYEYTFRPGLVPFETERKTAMKGRIAHLECWLCGARYGWEKPIGLCTCGKPLKVVYSLPEKFEVDETKGSMWRYGSVLPCEELSLGEGFTPLFRAERLGAGIWVKDESVNPTGSFKARGMAAAVGVAKQQGVIRAAVPSAGNAAGALAAYAARAGIEAHVFMPRDTPRACVVECEIFGAKVTLIDGLITDCASAMREMMEGEYLDVSTLREPYRIEGKKTMGYEIAEQMNWTLPDAIVYPTGGGTGLIGMWKAFDELEQMGMIGSKRPKMMSVQAEGCQPIVRAFENGSRFAEEHVGAKTIASGLRVPKAIGDFIILDAIRESGGAAVAVSDDAMVSGAKEMSAKTGICACPEGGACLAAYRQLVAQGFLSEGDEVVLFNTASGLKYQEALAR